MFNLMTGGMMLDDDMTPVIVKTGLVCQGSETLTPRSAWVGKIKNQRFSKFTLGQDGTCQ